MNQHIPENSTGKSEADYNRDLGNVKKNDAKNVWIYPAINKWISAVTFFCDIWSDTRREWTTFNPTITCAQVLYMNATYIDLSLNQKSNPKQHFQSAEGWNFTARKVRHLFLFISLRDWWHESGDRDCSLIIILNVMPNLNVIVSKHLIR